MTVVVWFVQRKGLELRPVGHYKSFIANSMLRAGRNSSVMGTCSAQQDYRELEWDTLVARDLLEE